MGVGTALVPISRLPQHRTNLAAEVQGAKTIIIEGWCGDIGMQEVLSVADRWYRPSSVKEAGV